ncbi:MAG: site-specific integrase [Pseudonocardiaceae bacterium]
MTGRPRLPINTSGEIWTKKVGDRYTAFANHRDTDGRTRQYERSASTAAAARARLKEALAAKIKLAEGRGTIRSTTTMEALAEEYFVRLTAQVDRGECSPGTQRLYRGHWDNHGEPTLGALTLLEADVQAIDRFLLELRGTSPTIAKTMRAVLSGMLGIAARYKAISTNPVRDVTRIRAGTAKPVRALEPSEAVDLWQKLTTLSQMPGETVWAQRRVYTPTRINPDIPDLVLWMLGTSLRIGQAIAVHWPAIDLEGATAAVGPNVMRVKGEGLRVNRGTSKTVEQTLDLPEAVVAMLARRREASRNPFGPVFPDPFGELRDPHNTLGDLRRALDLAGYGWVTSHTFRKTVATVLDDAGLSARQIADQLSHARPSMTQDRYMARRSRNSRAVAALDAMLSTDPERRVVPLDRT